uniref:Uncharacterized protein n=1 Tax=Chenopodium quinoa TaxID=63459 RepID=A0A803LQJ5_CHEQI
MRESDAIVTKTCREMEGAYCDFVEKLIGKPVLLAGPVLSKPATSRLDERFDCWLNGFSRGSVVFCALGSECILGKVQLHELVLGLELTGRPFLAALKPPEGYLTIESAMPEGFIERTKGKGIMHGGWVQQQLILQAYSILP